MAVNMLYINASFTWILVHLFVFLLLFRCRTDIKLFLLVFSASSYMLYLCTWQVDSFHVLRKSDPPFVHPAIFMKQGLASFVRLKTLPPPPPPFLSN